VSPLLINFEYMLMSREIITDLASMAKAHYAMFQKTTGKLPNKVVMFRDGVSEGQYAHVVE
jgi:eukaryotic translation initiation factor 2C